MATGPNTVGTFSDSLDDVRSSARTIKEFANIMGRLVDTTRLEANIGLDWKEVLLNKLSASNITELTDLEENPQQIVDSLFTIRPTLVGMSVFTTDLAKLRITKKVAEKLGVLMEQAMARKVDVDIIAAAQGATTDLGTANNPMSSDLVSAAVSIIRGNTTEPWDGAVATVMKTFQLKDIQDEGVSGFGTYPVSGGVAEAWLRKGFKGDLFDSAVYTDDNIPVDSSDDAVAFVFASGPGSAIVQVTGQESRYVTERKEGIGSGAEIMYATNQYGLGIRQQAWIRAITADASTPTG